jgi:anti-sigma B factor antagonist
MIAADPQTETEPWFSLAVVRAREEVRVQVVGELDLAATPKLHAQIGALLVAGSDQLIIDLGRVTFIDLTGVRLLLKLAQDASDDGWRLSLIRAHGQVRRILTLTGAVDQLPIRTSQAELGDVRHEQ